MNTAAAAKELFTRRIEKIRGARLNVDSRPQSIDDALAIQDQVSVLMNNEAGQAIAGWKCLLPPEDNLVIGPIYENSITRENTFDIMPQDGHAAIEPEIAFVFKQTLPSKEGTYTAEEVFSAVGEVRMALELIGSRYTDAQGYDFPELLADCLFNQGVYLGPQIDSAPSELLIKTSFHEQVLPGKHPNADVQAPLVWLANFLSSKGKAIEKGQVVITGSFAGVLNAPLDQPISIEYDGVGHMSVTANRF